MFELNSSVDIQLPKPAEVVTLPSDMSCHDHGYAQIVIGLKGQSEFEINGYGNRVGPGQGCVVSAGANHAFGGLADQTDILVLNLPVPSVDESVVLQQIYDLSKSEVYFHIDERLNQIIRLLSQEMALFPEDTLLSKACHDTLVTMLFRHMTRNVSVIKESRFDLAVIDNYIESNLSRRITIAQLAGSVFLGESQFHCRFKELLGMTPHQYVLQKRIEAARSLIDQGGYTLGQVAELTGFSGQSTFSHVFTRLQGMSPSVYKKRIQ
ncbi:HTH-type transcriptional activator Btr [Vibrio aerogenes CECT 7868]|uniref:HTH-type transcriptional activator Btr n=1 Tax=Vibrio aerogenes CECT 7868 TaxID=1216006 RepID=A0A1M5VYB8_9VIBR|nr:AraC family transcriptional regulator [Vibrio aerogenes]SHH80282.1 HTH-type transcriptional activator Btr [Vibrio aerogenes CECT 7868]